MVSEIVLLKLFCISRVCRVINMSRSSYRYRSIQDDTSVCLMLEDLAQSHPREGFWKAYGRIRNRGTVVNHKKLHRIYKDMGLALRRKIKKRLPARKKETLAQPNTMNDTWSIDFVTDALSNGRKFRSFNVIDDCNREILFIETDYSLKSSRVMWVLGHLVHRLGRPRRIRMDNGPEFIAGIAKKWSEMHAIEFKYIQPGKPTQNAYVERFNRTYREGVLDSYLFDSLEEVRTINTEWMEDYNRFRPHDALGGLSPMMWKCGQQAAPPARPAPDHIPTSNSNNNNKIEKSIEKSTFELY